MQSVWPEILTFLGVYLFAILSPGPNFFLVSNTAMTRTRKEGLLISFGVATGSGVFAFAGLAGLLPMVHSIPYFSTVMRFAGGGYLCWLGLAMLLTCRGQAPSPSGSGLSGVSSITSYRVGLLTNLTNTKAWAFYLSLFALMVETRFPLWSKVLLNIAMFAISLSWYSLVAVMVSSRTFQPYFLNFKPVIQSALGIALLVVAIKILWG